MIRQALRRACATGAMLALAATLPACQPVAGQAGQREGQAEQVDALVARCADAMARDICVAQRADEVPASRVAAASAAPVFVAGTGAVDAQAYAEIRTAGEAMCRLVQTRCRDDWQGPACQTARSLWPRPSPS